MTTHTMVNDIDVGRMHETMDAIRKDPELAKFRFRAHNELVAGTQCRTEIRDFYGAKQEDMSRSMTFKLTGDEPDVLLGTDRAPNATEALLHALGACLNTTFMYKASAEGVNVEKLELDLEGDIDLRGIMGLSDKVRNGFQRIRITFRVKADAPEEKIRSLVEAAKAHSPVFDIVTNPVPVETKLELE